MLCGKRGKSAFRQVLRVGVFDGVILYRKARFVVLLFALFEHEQKRALARIETLVLEGFLYKFGLSRVEKPEKEKKEIRTLR